MNKTVKHAGRELEVEFSKYGNGRTALVLITNEEGYPDIHSKATVNIPEVKLEDDEVFIKDWSENEGILDALVSAGIVSEPLEEVPTGFCIAYKCKLLYRDPNDE